jgi:hypothetical protein
VDERRERLLLRADQRHCPPRRGRVHLARLTLLVDELVPVGKPECELERRVAERMRERWANFARPRGAELDHQVAERAPPAPDEREPDEDREREQERVRLVDAVERSLQTRPAAEPGDALGDELAQGEDNGEAEREKREPRARRRLAQTAQKQPGEVEAEGDETRPEDPAQGREVERGARVEERWHARRALRAAAGVSEQERHSHPGEAEREGDGEQHALDAAGHMPGGVGEHHAGVRGREQADREHPERRRESRGRPLEGEVGQDRDELPGQDQQCHPFAARPASDCDRGDHADARRRGEDGQPEVGFPKLKLAHDIHRHQREHESCNDG